MRVTIDPDVVMPILNEKQIRKTQDDLEKLLGREAAAARMESARRQLADELLSVNREEAAKRYDMSPEKQDDKDIATTERTDYLGGTVYRVVGRLLTFKHFDFIPNNNHLRPRTPVETRVKVGGFLRQGKTVFVPETNKIPRIPYIRERKLYWNLNKKTKDTFRSLRTLSIPQFYYNADVHERSDNVLMERFYAILEKELENDI